MQRRRRKGQYKPKKNEDRNPKDSWGSKERKPSRSKIKRNIRDGKVESPDDIEWMEYDDN